ncbi:pyridoxamine 5'-phosphate oxidase family protein [soil metagenome]
MSDVQVDRPVMPDGYGVPDTTDGLLDWSVVDARLAAATEYWMATTRPDGRPHVVPRWGVWRDGQFFYDGSPQTRHARNLAGNAACALHLESGTDVVILEGRSGPSAPITGELGQRLSEVFQRKYRERGYAPPPDAWSGDDAGGLAVFTPVTGLAWSDFPADVTRFHFPTD